MAALKTPKNIRPINPNCCMTCYHLKQTEDDLSNPYLPVYSYLYCERMEDELPCEEDELQRTICDYYKKKPSPKRKQKQDGN